MVVVRSDIAALGVGVGVIGIEMVPKGSPSQGQVMMLWVEVLSNGGFMWV